jgi:hypothetical protein
MAAQMEVIDGHILYTRVTGELNAASFEAHVKERVAFVKEHIDGVYVEIFDLSKAHLAFMDLNLSGWAVKTDPNMLHVIGISPQLLARVSVNILANVKQMNISLVNTIDEAKVKAREILAEADAPSS